MGCQQNGLDLSPGLFRHFVDINAGEIYGSWVYGDGGSAGNSPTSSSPAPTLPAPAPSTTHREATSWSLSTLRAFSTISSTMSAPSLETTSTTSLSPLASPTSNFAPNPPQFLDQMNTAILQLGGLIGASASLNRGETEARLVQ